MDKKYWDSIGGKYDRYINDSIHGDRKGVIKRRMGQYAFPGHVAGDFGCGVGKYLAVLSARFKRVYAVDQSAKLLKMAARSCEKLGNVRLIHDNLRRPKSQMGKVHFAVCANVLIMPSKVMCMAILRNIHGRLRRGGHLMLVVPSMESALYADQQLVQWYRRDGLCVAEARREGIPATAIGAAELLAGVVRIDGIATQHYLREQAVTMLCDRGFDTASVDKVEYGWESEFNDPPSWMGEPYPWDWLFIARKC